MNIRKIQVSKFDKRNISLQELIKHNFHQTDSVNNCDTGHGDNNDFGSPNCAPNFRLKWIFYMQKSVDGNCNTGPNTACLSYQENWIQISDGKGAKPAEYGHLEKYTGFLN